MQEIPRGSEEQELIGSAIKLELLGMGTQEG